MKKNLSKELEYEIKQFTDKINEYSKSCELFKLKNNYERFEDIYKDISNLNDNLFKSKQNSESLEERFKFLESQDDSV